MPEADQPLPILVFVRDLLFSSKVVAAAKAANLPFRVVRDISILHGLDGRALIVDLNQDGFIDAAAAWKQSCGKLIVGFVSHTDTAVIVRARAAGFDRIMTRGQFTQAIDLLLLEPGFSDA